MIKRIRHNSHHFASFWKLFTQFAHAARARVKTENFGKQSKMRQKINSRDSQEYFQIRKMGPQGSPRSTTSSCDFKTSMPTSSKAVKKTKRRNFSKSKSLTERRQKLDFHIGIRALSFYWFSMDTRIKILQTYPRNVSCFLKPCFDFLNPTAFQTNNSLVTLFTAILYHKSKSVKSYTWTNITKIVQVPSKSMLDNNLTYFNPHLTNSYGHCSDIGDTLGIGQIHLYRKYLECNLML